MPIQAMRGLEQGSSSEVRDEEQLAALDDDAASAGDDLAHNVLVGRWAHAFHDLVLCSEATRRLLTTRRVQSG